MIKKSTSQNKVSGMSCFLKRLLPAFFIFFAVSAFSQNIGPAATSTHSGGGVSASGYGPELYNDNVIQPYNSGGTYNWGWVSSNGWIEYVWTSAQTFNKVKFFKDNRPFTSMDIQTWDGSSYVTVKAAYTGTSATEDSVIFTSP